MNAPFPMNFDTRLLVIHDAAIIKLGDSQWRIMVTEAPIEDHDLGLAHDLKAMKRRQALFLLGSAGTMGMLPACGGGGSASSASTSSSTSASGSGTCVAFASETIGPYPADGTNTSSGPTSNVLPLSAAVRSDIRSSFVGSSTATAAGVVLTVTLTVVNVNASCAPLSGYAVYLWHCDAPGRYSLYDLPNESYLRGIQVTNSSGQVTFTTILPGCYAGRYPHMHFEVFSSPSTATSGRFASLVSQIAIPEAVCTAVYAESAYGSSATNFARVSLATDGIFADNSTAQKAAMVLTMSGSVTAGYAGSATIGLAL